MLIFLRYRQNSDYMIWIKPIHKIHSYTCKIFKSDGDIKVQWLAPKSNDLVSCWTKSAMVTWKSDGTEKKASNVCHVKPF